MANFAPKPTRTTGGKLVPAQRLGIGATPVSLTAFNPNTTLIAAEIQTSNVLVTFDGTVPSANNGHILYAGQVYHWSADTAKCASFIEATGTSATLQATEFMAVSGSDTAITDAAIIKPSAGGGGAVSSVFSRAGAVTAQTGDYTAAQITGLGFQPVEILAAQVFS